MFAGRAAYSPPEVLAEAPAEGAGSHWIGTLLMIRTWALPATASEPIEGLQNNGIVYRPALNQVESSHDAGHPRCNSNGPEMHVHVERVHLALLRSPLCVLQLYWGKSQSRTTL